MKHLEEEFASVKTAHENLQSRYFKLEDGYSKQSDELIHGRAVTVDALRQLEEFGMEYAEIEQRVTEKLHKEKEVAIKVVKNVYRAEKDKIISEMEDRHARVVDDLRINLLIQVRNAKRETQVGYQVERLEHVATIKALQLEVEALDHALMTGESILSEQPSTNKVLKKEVNRLQNELSESSYKVSENLSTTNSLETKLGILEKSLFDSHAYANMRTEAIETLDIKIIKLEQDLAISLANESTQLGTMESMKITISDLTSRSLNLEASLSAVSSELHEANDSLSDRKGSIQSYKRRLVVAQKKRSEAEKNLEEVEAALSRKNEEQIKTSTMLHDSWKEVKALNALVQAINKELPDSTFQSILDGTSLALIRRENALRSTSLLSLAATSTSEQHENSTYFYAEFIFDLVTAFRLPHLRRHFSNLILKSPRCKALVKYSLSNDCRASIFGYPVQSFVAVVKALLVKQKSRPRQRFLCGANRRRIGIMALPNGIKFPVRCSSPGLRKKRSLEDAKLEPCLTRQVKRRASDSDRVQLGITARTLQGLLEAKAKMLANVRADTIMSNTRATQGIRRSCLTEEEEAELVNLFKSTDLSKPAEDEMDTRRESVEIGVEEFSDPMEIQEEALEVSLVEDPDIMDTSGGEESLASQDSMDLSV